MILKTISMVYLVNVLVNFGYSLIKGSPSYRQCNYFKKKIGNGFYKKENDEFYARASMLQVQDYSIQYDTIAILEPICNFGIYFEILSNVTDYIVEKLNMKG